MIAQTIAYGLFSARATGEELMGLAHLEDMIPDTNNFLRELFAEFSSVSGHKRDQIDFDELGVSELVKMLNEADIRSIMEDFGRQTGAGREDPVVNFYELFLKEYDKDQKVKRGVFYTPKPVVSFIVRSVHEILKKDFRLEDGLADTTTWGEMAERNKYIQVPIGVSPYSPFVQILDPAVGTGTFIETVIEVVYNTMTTKWRKQGKKKAEIDKLWNKYVPEYLLPRLYGFELMMAPYAVCHMKLGLKLKEMGYNFKTKARLNVYLTNTLEEVEEFFGDIPDFLAHESQEANRAKRGAAATVIIGNPPYAGHSANKNKWSRDLLHSKLNDGADSYFKVDGKNLVERNPKWLNDDYVKFIRYGQYRIAKTGQGILAFITNHGYLDNPTFRGMRHSLMTTFQEINVLDLHGNAKKKEQCPDGSKDENVFDIQQGVTIGVFSKRDIRVEDTNIFHDDLWGVRDFKYSFLSTSEFRKMEWRKLTSSQPMYLLVPENIELRTIYEKGKKITDIMPVYSVGIATARDNFTIHWAPEAVYRTVSDFVTLSVEEAREKYGLRNDVRDWKVALAQKDIKSKGLDEDKIIPILYRPFDIRYTYYTGKSRGFHCRPRPEVMGHMLEGRNLGLITSRLTKGETFGHIQVTRNISEVICMSPNTSNNGFLFPLYLYPVSKKYGRHNMYVEKIK